MEGLVDVSEFIDELKSQGLVIVPNSFVQEAIKEYRISKLKSRYLNKKALSYKEIADAELWGSIAKRSVKAFAEKYAKEHEIFVTPKGGIKVKKIITSAVVAPCEKKEGLCDPQPSNLGPYNVCHICGKLA